MAWRGNDLLEALAVDKGCLTVPELVEATGIERKQVAKSCGILLSRGLVDRPRLGCYRLNETGRQMLARGTEVRSGPRGRHTGKPSPRRGTLRARAWKALRQAGKATVADLVTMAGTGTEKNPENNLQRYLNWLAQAGYVVPLPRREKGTAPTSNGHIRWLLVRNSGPQAPILRQSRREIYDPNTGEVHSLAGDGS